MVEASLSGEALRLKEARLCLDFTNTVDWHASAHPEESLNTYADLVTWGLDTQLLTDEQAHQLLHSAERQPEQADAVLRRARDLREAIYRIVVSILHHDHPQPDDLMTLNNALSAGLPLLRVVAVDAGFHWSWAWDAQALDCILWPVARSAAELLTSNEISRLGQCADDRGCGWLFLDTSRNHSRRWCSIESCGNRAKAQRHYQKIHGAPDS